MPVAWDHSAFLAVDDDDAAIAVLSYINQKWSNSLFIVIGYVIPSRRRTGIYRALWEAIVARAREMKIPKVVGATHPNNKAMRATARRLGRREVGIVLSFHVEAKDLPDGTLAS
ncbi:MAG: GNAT family N-acetyltransferase [Rhodospirillales bacterium]